MLTQFICNHVTKSFYMRKLYAATTVNHSDLVSHHNLSRLLSVDTRSNTANPVAVIWRGKHFLLQFSKTFNTAGNHSVAMTVRCTPSEWVGGGGALFGGSCPDLINPYLLLLTIFGYFCKLEVSL